MPTLSREATRSIIDANHAEQGDDRSTLSDANHVEGDDRSILSANRVTDLKVDRNISDANHVDEEHWMETDGLFRSMALRFCQVDHWKLEPFATRRRNELGELH